MTETQKVADRIQRARKELDEVSEHLDRLARDLAKPEPKKIELVGQAEVAVMAGVKSSTVGVWVGRGKLPAPAAELACGRIWLKADIEAWLKRRPS
jgi:hypothetical protein